MFWLVLLTSLYFHQLQCFHFSDTRDKSSQFFPQQTHVETKLLLCYLCCCWEIFRQRFSAAVLPPLLLPQPSHVRPLPWCRSWVTARAPSLPCGVRQIIEQNLSSTLFIEALFMLRDNLHNYYNFLGFFLLTRLVVVSNLWKLSCVSPLPHVSLIVFLEPGKPCPFFA